MRFRLSTLLAIALMVTAPAIRVWASSPCIPVTLNEMLRAFNNGSYYHLLALFPEKILSGLSPETLQIFDYFSQRGGSKLRLGQMLDTCLKARNCREIGEELLKLREIAEKRGQIAEFYHDPEAFRLHLPDAETRATGLSLREPDLDFTISGVSFDRKGLARIDVDEVQVIRLADGKLKVLGSKVRESRLANIYCLDTSCNELIHLSDKTTRGDYLAMNKEVFSGFHQAGIPTAEINFASSHGSCLVMKNPGKKLWTLLKEQNGSLSDQQIESLAGLLKRGEGLGVELRMNMIA